jgi:hypothetical protein
VSFVGWFWILPLSISWYNLVKLGVENIARVGFERLKEVSERHLSRAPVSDVTHSDAGTSRLRS